MACPTCSATMQGLGNGMFHCPRCGTIQRVSNSPDWTEPPYVPMLVERVRTLRMRSGVCSDCRELWYRLGIDEAIHLPADRSTREKPHAP